jgi:eukaryotic-like serine/threonine-protein kinase
MDQDRWKTVNVIFHAALEVSSSERHSFVLTASEGDPDLQAEVELLLKADQDAGSYLESPLVPAELFSNSVSPVNPGDVLCGRFRILRAVGEGGMGHVFEALDSELAVHVALKIIRPEIAANPEALVRFRQEVRLARRITHPNVCRTFDIERETRVVDAIRGTKQEVVFLTMEFLEGETLASRIKRDGPLPLNEALHVARQTADALQAANTLGIVHRDMKPANIMLVPSEATAPIGFRAVITDFGLARLDPVVSPSNLSAFSNTARPIGTLAYMAPEQLENAQISSATDIYAFGLVLFEMVTGTRAFPSDNLLGGMAQRLTGSPPLPQSLVPGLPTPWCRSIEGCLRLKPADRFQCATDVMEVLDGKRASLPRIGKPSLVQRLTLASWPLPRRLLAFATICFTAVALFLGVLRLYRSVTGLKVVSGALVYLAPVSNQTGEKSLDNVTELIRAGLSQSVQFNLLDQGRVGDILQRMTKSPDSAIDSPTAREIAMRAGAVRVVFATVTGGRGNYKLDIDVQQPDYSPSLFRVSWHASFPWRNSRTTLAPEGTIPPELSSAIRQATDSVRREVGESQNDIARLDVPPENVTTRDWQALTDYDQAQKFLRQDRKEDAITLLKDAVSRDPGFARAYADLADNIASTGNTDEAYRYYIKALNDDSGQRLSRKERDFIRGDFATDSRDYQTALEALRDSSAFYEGDFFAWFKQAYPLEKLNRPGDALQVLRRADALSTTHGATGEMAFPYLLLGDFSSARRSIEAFRAAGHTDQASIKDGVEAVCEGDYTRANDSFTQLQKSTDHDIRIVAFLDETRLLAEQGLYADALRVNSAAFDAVSGFAPAEMRAELWLDRGYLNLISEDRSRGLSDISQALSVSSDPNTFLMASTIVGRVLPTLSAPDRHRARQLLGHMEKLIPRENPEVVFEIARLQIRGEALLSLANARGAVKLFHAADQLDAPAGPRDYLARGLVAAASDETDPARAFALRQQALLLYEKVALRPVTVWLDANAMPPGSVADQMGEYLKLARTLNKSDENVQKVSAALRKLRKNPPDNPLSPTIKGKTAQLFRN